MKRALQAMLFAAGLGVLGGCATYEPLPVPSPQERLERSWSAAAGAMADQSVTVTAQDRSAGVISGVRGNLLVSARVQTLADGRIQVRFDATGPAGADTALAHRLSESYDRRMGR